MSSPIESPTAASAHPLKDRLEDSERTFRETGRYKGLDELPIVSSQPMELERFHSRLVSTVIATRETVKHIAASPGTREIGEFVISLYTPEGDAIALSTGIMVHVHTLSEFIKFMIRDGYEENPEIRPGDVFENNESWAGGVHTPDVQTVIPIYHGEKLVGWVGSVTHELDVGSAEGGSMICMSPERYHEGLHISAEKIGENDELRHDYINRLRWNLRMADWWLLDTKSKLAGMLMVRDAVMKLIDEVGLEFYEQATNELIEDSRRSFLRRIKRTLVPGTYRLIGYNFFQWANESFVHPFARKDMGQVVPLELTVGGDGRLTTDFEGASRWDFHPYNATPSGVNGALWVSITQMLAYDGKVNDGPYHAVVQKFSKGSVLDTDYPGSSTSSSWWTTIPLYSGFMRLMSHALFARGFLEEVVQGTPTQVPNFAGMDGFGRPIAVTNFEIAGGSSGAKATWDGIDCGHQIWNPEAVMGDAEVWELALPKLYLARSLVRNHHGMGRFRGGASWEATFLLHNTEMLSYVIAGTDQGGIAHQKGMFGGYPAPGPRYFWARGTDLNGKVSADGSAIPRTMRDIEARLTDGRLGCEEYHFNNGPLWSPSMRNGDLCGYYVTGGSGYGDPLDREPEHARSDLELGVVDPAYLKRVYGIVAGPRDDAEPGTAWDVDPAATGEARDGIRRQRLEQSVPFAQWWRAERATAAAPQVPPVVTNMYAKSAMLSDKVVRQYLEFWQLESWPYGGQAPAAAE